MEILQRLAQESGLSADQVRPTLALFDEGATIPFIARYRKEKTGNLDETQILDLSHRYEFHRELEARKETILSTIREQGKLTPELEAKIRETTDKTELEDLYLPFKPKRTTRALKAREAGLEPLSLWLVCLDDPAADLAAEASKFLNPEKGVETADQAVQGACDILAEEWAEDAELRKWLRALTTEEGVLLSAAKKESADKKTKFEMYYNFREKIGSLPSHRILALMRGEKEKVLKLEFDYPKEKAVRHLVYRVIPHPRSAAAPRLLEAVVDALDRLMAPGHRNRDPPGAADAGRGRGLHRLRREPPRSSARGSGRTAGRHRDRPRFPHRLQDRGRRPDRASSWNTRADLPPTSRRTTRTDRRLAL